jgi:hypothetical protein
MMVKAMGQARRMHEHGGVLIMMQSQEMSLFAFREGYDASRAIKTRLVPYLQYALGPFSPHRRAFLR